MSHSDRPKPDVNATIQLDQLDAEQVRLEDEPHAPAHRVTPPPLPPEVRASAAPVPHLSAGGEAPRPSAPPPARATGKTVLYGAIFVVLLAIAIVGGLKIGGLAHTNAPAPSASVAAAPVVTRAPTPSASASVVQPMQTITIPTIEMR